MQSFIRGIYVTDHGTYAGHSSRCWGHSSGPKTRAPWSECLHSGEGTHTDNQSKKTGSRTGGAKAYAKAKDQHSVGNGRCCCIWRGNKTFLSQKWAFEQRRERYTGASHAAIWSEPQQQGCEGAARLSWSRRARRSVWPVSGGGQGQVLGSTKGTFPLHSYIAPEFG